MSLAYNWDFSFLDEYGSLFWVGTKMTLSVSLVAVIGGLLVGILVALVRLSRIWPIRFIGTTYVEIIRGTPLLVQVYLFYYGLPLFLGVDLGIFAAACIALSINSGAYIAEIMRAGIQAVDRGQMEAARSLGMSRTMAMRPNHFAASF
ncbi:amino acid ABC transporter permease [Cohnella kolymensis]|uniref:amino acid ABC transporter permease n=1 Tax=Cohnella kolymensis TaxID=1590652 RepID=UPI000ADE9168|nr:amino acid ABC transporter permease [Cohnella kolymensis]